MTCKMARRGCAVLATMLWVAAVGVIATADHDGHTNIVLLLVALAAAASAVSGIGYFLSKGSSETVYQLGYEAGLRAGRREASDELSVPANVAVLSSYRG